MPGFAYVNPHQILPTALLDWNAALLLPVNRETEKAEPYLGQVMCDHSATGKARGEAQGIPSLQVGGRTVRPPELSGFQHLSGRKGL